MATIAMTVAAERWLDEVVLVGSATNVDGVIADQYTLPAGLGDVAIMWLEFTAAAIDVAATITSVSVLARIVSPDGATTVDIVGNGELRLINQTANALGMTATVDPDALVLWRQDEKLALFTAELDTDATPTADTQLRVKVVRVRPLEAPATPLQLVR